MKRDSLFTAFFLLLLLGVLFVLPASAQLSKRIKDDWKGEISLPHETISLKIKFFQEQGDPFADIFTNNNDHYPKIPVILSQNRVVFTFLYNGSLIIRVLGTLEIDGIFTYKELISSNISSSPYRYKLIGKAWEIAPDDSTTEGEWMLREDLSCDK